MEQSFPEHWGEPPGIQTRDYVELPGGYGFGSGTLRSWIEQKMAEDAASNNNAGPWGNLVGMDGEVARQTILQREPNLQVDLVPEGSMVTMDFREDRVRIFIDGANKVVGQPRKG